MTTTLLIIIAGVKAIQSALPQWQSEVNDWIKEDLDGFNKFKNDVFATIHKVKYTSSNDGFEIIKSKL